MMYARNPLIALICATLGLLALPTYSAETVTTASFTSQNGAKPFSSSNIRTGDPDALIFTSPPRETPEEGQKIYGPVAEHLTKALGRKVVYRHPGTWGAYRSEMLRGDYDIVFDGPHFNSYRVEKLNHNVLVKLPGRLDFAVVTRKGEKYTSISQMGGRSFCTHAPPNLGALVLMSQFDNPARQPYLIPMEGWDTIYKGVTSGRCVGAVIPLAQLKKLDKDQQLKAVYTTPSMPNQAFSAGPRVTLEQQAKLSAALLAPEADSVLDRLRASSKINEKLLATNNAEYNGIGVYLRGEYGYY